MPNGHGGIPFLGAPVALLALFALVAALPHGARFAWLQASICLALAALAGWRLAYHLHLRAACAYEGAGTSPDARRRAMRRYAFSSVAYSALAAIAGYFVLGWRGLL